ncbi:hypothetical protein TBLA_0C06190 [Henningerozyma blattae CBS 6284]|uniref:Dolichyl-diphosphooligosaccharide--protein glycosyltransferase subunit 1 n=1 Tax=Henningerozyma blattae (strain ATCC 34711 / CBS 6284 / DSM 70876 / NBRC 10599 / NRRL Y-10934 / UCD 77-7) TaxID=1071380 RepID=I2H213_HENB6|nr:hypothetical protein TBLA_0C06190 [Tetrapisispora blattae CBS 6284]CCH60415.1 hypothetical protein TBLA_0C06190 [Tetrapisispora blattae CBS 6284]
MLSNMWGSLTVIVTLLSSIISAELMNIPDSWENVNYNRIIDVSKSYTTEIFEVKVKNIGSTPTNEYYFALSKDIIENVSVFTASLTQNFQESFLNSSILKQGSITDGGFTIGYSLIIFPDDIQPNEEVTFLAKVIYNIAGKPYPEHIAMEDEQFLLLETNRLPLSIYPTSQSSLRVIGSNSFEEIDAPENQHLIGQNSENGFIFENWASIHALEIETPLKIRYSHNSPINKVYKLTRDVWLSNWANTIQFEESYELTNAGAKLNKGFSRFEYMRLASQNKQGHHRAIIEHILPSDSSDHYFTDLVGMVSTARVQNDHYFLKPRYPIFGGWNYNFTVGWTNSLPQFLHTSASDVEEFKNDNVYLLSVPALNGPLDTSYDIVELSIYLPEGAVIHEIDPPFPFIDLSIDTVKSYLDLGNGHVKITLKFQNLVDELSIANVFVKYSYSTTAMYKKPLSIACYVFVALISLFFLKQIDLKVTSTVH